MTNLTAWYDDVLPQANGCPLAFALQKIRESAIAYCRASKVWRYLDLQPIDAVAGQQTYVIGTPAAQGSLPAGVSVVHVYQVNWKGEPLKALTPAEFKAKSPTWFDDEGDPEVFTLFNEGKVSLWYIPSASDADAIVIPEVALAPLQTATTVDDSIYEHGREAITKGALGRIYKNPGKPYSDPLYGAELIREAEAMAGGHQARAAGGRGHARLRTKTITR